MRCWISKQGKKGVWSLFLNELWKILKKEDFDYKIWEKGHILMPFSGIAPTKRKFCQEFKGTICLYIYIYAD